MREIGFHNERRFYDRHGDAITEQIIKFLYSLYKETNQISALIQLSSYHAQFPCKKRVKSPGQNNRVCVQPEMMKNYANT